MKIKEGFEMRELSGQSVVIAVGKAAEVFNGMIRLNDSGTELWKRLSVGCDEESLVECLINNYEVDAPTAQEDVRQFLTKLYDADILI